MFFPLSRRASLVLARPCKTLSLSRSPINQRCFVSSSYNCRRATQPTRSSLKRKTPRNSEADDVALDARSEYREAREGVSGALYAEKNPLKALDIARTYAMKRYSALGQAKVEDTTFALYRMVLEYHAQRKEFSRIPLVIESMKRIGLPVTIETYTGYMGFLGKAGHVGAVQALFKQLRKDGHSPTTRVYNTLIDTSVLQGDVKTAMKYFEEMPKSGAAPDTVTYNLILKLLSKAKELDSSIAQGVFEEMKSKEIPLNQATIVTLLKIFCEAKSEQNLLDIIETAKQHQIPLNIKCYASIIRYYALQHKLKQAFEWFEDLKTKGMEPDAMIFSQLLEGTVRVDWFEGAMDVFKMMETSGVQLEKKTLSSLFILFLKQHKPEEALRLYDENSKLTHEPRSYYNFIVSLAKYPQYHSRCHTIFKDMVYAGVKPNDKVLSALLHVCLRESSSSKAEAYFENAKKYMTLKLEHFNDFMAIMAKEGSHDKVVELYEELLAMDYKPNSTTHRLVLRALVHLNRLDEALEHGITLKRKQKLDDSLEMLTEAFTKAGRAEDLKALDRVDEPSSGPGNSKSESIPSKDTAESK